MKWQKLGLLYKPENEKSWMKSHASIPIVRSSGDGKLRVYFSTRNMKGLSYPTYLEVAADNPLRILKLPGDVLLKHGLPGTFDDAGIMSSWLVEDEDSTRLWMYYIGWNKKDTVPYHLSIGLAESNDGGVTFMKHSNGPLLDRGISEIYFNTAPCVLKDNDQWRMWYVSGTGWQKIRDRFEPKYLIRHAVSDDGINWEKYNEPCIGYSEDTEAIGRPCVFRENGLFKMLYSYRMLDGYRTDPKKSYRLGYAESADGIKWRRRDELVGIQRSEAGWDSEMMCYCYYYKAQDRALLFYNGNGFGSSGIGVAVREY